MKMPTWLDFHAAIWLTWSDSYGLNLARTGLLDFAAFSVASRALDEQGDRALIPELSIIKCREVFDAVSHSLKEWF